MGIGKKIKDRRKELGMTQQELADKMGYKNRSAICLIETGKEENLTFERIGEFAKVLQMNPLELMDTNNNIDFILRNDEIELLLEYRSADAATREMIKRILSYKENLNE